MKKIIFTQLLALIAMSFVFAGNSKNKFQQGYVVTNGLDTLWGNVALNVEKVNALQCQFQVNQSDSVITYLPGEIQSYRFLENGNMYVSEQITLKDEEPKLVFLEFLEQGEINLYFYMNATDNKEYFFVRRRNESQLIRLEQNVTFIQSIDGKSFNRYDNRYIGQLTYLLSDAPSLRDEINKTKLTGKSLKKLLSKYQALTSESSPVIFASSNKNKVITDIYVSAGASCLTAQLARRGVSNNFIKQNDWSPLIRLGVNLRYPRLSDSFGLTIALDLAQFDKQWHDDYSQRNLTYKTFLINPQIGLHYTYTKSVVRPIIEAGCNISIAAGTESYATADWNPQYFEDNYFTDHTNALKLGFFASAGADFMVTPKYAISLKVGYAKVYGIYSVENMQMCNLSLGFKF